MKTRLIKAAITRAIRTICQTAVSMISVSTFLSEVSWIEVLSASALAGLISLLTSIATGLPEADE